MRRVAIALCSVSLALFARATMAQDCGHPKSGVERLICSNDRVSAAANRMAVAFLSAYRRADTDAKRNALRARQREWESAERDACPDVPCLLHVYADRTLELQQN